MKSPLKPEITSKCISPGEPESFESITIIELTSHDPEDIVTVEALDSYPEGGIRAWLVIFGGFLLNFSTFGLQTSVGLFQLYWSNDQLKDYPLTQISWIPATFIFLSLAISIKIGALFDQYGARGILIVGSLGYAVTFYLLAHCTQYWHFLLCLGFLGGLSSAAITTVAVGVPSHWFKRRRGLANGITTTGSALGGVTFPLVLQATLTKYGWGPSMYIVAGIVSICGAVGVLTVRTRLPPSKSSTVLDLAAFRDARFNWLCVSIFGFELVLITALGLIPLYAIEAGYSLSSSFYVVTAMNCGSILGRLIPGYISDHIGRFNALLLMTMFTLSSMLFIWAPFGQKSVVALYIFMTLFGFGTGSFVALSAACVGQICNTAVFGKWIGASYSLVSVATLISIPLGSVIQTKLGSQALVGFLCGALAMALLTCAIARAACLGWTWRWKVLI